MEQLQATWNKNDKKAKMLIGIFSAIVFVTVTVLGKYNLAGKVELPFDKHIFALINAIINATVSLALIAGLILIKQGMQQQHKKVMLLAMVLSVLFLVSYIGHHLFAGEAKFGDIDGDKVLSATEEAAAGNMRFLYLFILITHIPLAGLVLPFILFAAYRALTGDYEKHKKMARIIWPIWLYVAITGVVIYFMISPYYH